MQAQVASTRVSSAAAVQALPVTLLACFQRRMQYQGWQIDLQRMCVDTAYAHQCLATAHTTADESLRAMALQLFDAYGRNAAATTLH
jgi:hypothetical protein